MPRNKCPWFDPATKPERPGLYSVKLAPKGRPFWRYWNGSQWGTVSRFADRAVANQTGPVRTDVLGWRGVLK